MELLPLAFAGGWASGINAYATAFLLGAIGRFFNVDMIPEGLQRTDVLVVMGILAVIEFVADKIPYVDSIWDAVSTIIRPLAGAAIGALLAGADGELTTVTLAAVGGVTALVTHLTKAGIRLAINTLPEPVSNIGASLIENTAVVAVVSLAVANPALAAGIAVVLLVISVLIFIVVARQIVWGYRKLRQWLADRRQPAAA